MSHVAAQGLKDATRINYPQLIQEFSKAIPELNKLLASKPLSKEPLQESYSKIKKLRIFILLEQAIRHNDTAHSAEILQAIYNHNQLYKSSKSVKGALQSRNTMKFTQTPAYINRLLYQALLYQDSAALKSIYGNEHGMIDLATEQVKKRDDNVLIVNLAHQHKNTKFPVFQLRGISGRLADAFANEDQLSLLSVLKAMNEANTKSSSLESTMSKDHVLLLLKSYLINNSFKDFWKGVDYVLSLTSHQMRLSNNDLLFVVQPMIKELSSRFKLKKNQNIKKFKVVGEFLDEVVASVSSSITKVDTKYLFLCSLFQLQIELSQQDCLNINQFSKNIARIFSFKPNIPTQENSSSFPVELFLHRNDTSKEYELLDLMLKSLEVMDFSYCSSLTFFKLLKGLEQLNGKRYPITKTQFKGCIQIAINQIEQRSISNTSSIHQLIVYYLQEYRRLYDKLDYTTYDVILRYCQKQISCGLMEKIANLFTSPQAPNKTVFNQDQFSAFENVRMNNDKFNLNGQSENRIRYLSNEILTVATKQETNKP